MESNYITIKARLIEKFDSIYTTYIWENLNVCKEHPSRYITCIRLPNWEACAVNIGDIGFLQYKLAQAGITTWFNQATKELETYNYDGIYFHSFIKEREIIENPIIRF